MKAGLLNGSDNGRNTALSLSYGLRKFLLRNTGETDAGDVQHFVINNEGVVANNRHFLAYTRQEYQQNGDATTEGQSLIIIGCVEMYNATKDPRWLEMAETYFDAYIQYFYDGQPIPTVPAPYYCNWIINGKEPYVSHYPLHPIYPTNGGFKSVPLMFVNGKTQIPSGAPFYGEWLDVVSFAHRGHMAWMAINATVKNISETVDWQNIYDNYRITSSDTPYKTTAWIDWASYLGDPSGYTPIWGGDGTQTPLDVDWMVAWTGQRISGDGDVLETGLPSSRFGEVQLKDTSLNGCYLLNFAVKLPVTDGGVLIQRNKPWHNRPVAVPVPTNAMSNASDAEQWFAEAARELYKVTGVAKYNNAFLASMETIKMYAQIDALDKFFRKSTVAITPFTDGICYVYSYPSDAHPTFTRDSDGYILMSSSMGSQQYLEQQAIWYRVNNSSKLHIEYSGTVGTQGDVEIQFSPVKQEDYSGARLYHIPLPTVTSNDVTVSEFFMTQFVATRTADGNEYYIADERNIDAYGDTGVSTMVYYPSIIDTRPALVSRTEMGSADDGVTVGFYVNEKTRVQLRRIYYRCGADNFNLRIEDADGWRWWWMLPATNGEWTTIDLLPSDLTFSGYQPNANDRPEPSAPNYIDSEDFTILLDTDPTDSPAWIEWYAINDLPEKFYSDSQYTMLYRMIFRNNSAFDVRIGDCDIRSFRDDNLAYTPGVIPFSNNLDAQTQLFDGWHGMPYPGYQYPWVWAAINDDSKLLAMVDFLYDSQQAYKSHFNVLGPGAAAYYWNRWDNLSYGPADTWTFYHWGDGEPWAGYQPRAFHGACRAWLYLVENHRVVPTKLRSYCMNWVNWLASFQDANNGRNPTDFPSDALPSVDGFTAHMSGLWLAGACCIALSGNETANVRKVIENTLTELQDNYKVVSANHVMNGCWSDAVRADTDNGIFYGFHAGELLRGFGRYLQYINRGAT